MNLEEALKSSWSKETTADSARWTPENPAWGQCAITALVVQDYLGGEIVWAEAQMPSGEKLSHYFNKFSGYEYDATRAQFPQGTQIPEGIPKPKNFATTRDYVLSFEPTRKRYEALKEKVDALMQKNYKTGLS